ncbi:MAG: sigma-70 family RNA polymerase sigma factor, partial [Clostridia bacterium]|nr:sigma-70 family RNA polymerase sigma factor [Clostridia bacterium]
METENEVLTELFEDYRGTLMNLCLAKGLSKEDTEDAISEAFCRFLDDYEDLEELNQFQQKRWLYNTVNNICHEIFRSKIRIVDND